MRPKAQETEEKSHLIGPAAPGKHLWQDVKDTVHNADIQVRVKFSPSASA
jgi:hypothetical protein